MQAIPVVVEYKQAHSSESAELRGLMPDVWQLEVYARSEPDEKGRVYKQLIDCRQTPDLTTHKRYVAKTYGNVVKELDLSPVQPSLF